MADSLWVRRVMRAAGSVSRLVAERSGLRAYEFTTTYLYQAEWARRDRAVKRACARVRALLREKEEK